MPPEISYVEAWEPTEKEYAAYARREAELAKQNIEFLQREHGVIGRAYTLHGVLSYCEGYQAFVAEQAAKK